MSIWPVVLLMGLWLAVVGSNFESGKWLLGWDNLVPELDLWLNLKRALFAGWQEYQGLGLAGGMGHAADLPRVLILILMSLVVPTQYLRFGWVALMLLSGVMGTYLLVRELLSGWKNKNVVGLAAVASGAYYLLNLATVQYFYTPFETFSSFFGFLPWLVWIVLRVIKKGGRWWWGLVLISFLGSSAFYVQTLFVVWLVILGCMLINASIRYGKTGLKKSMGIGLVVLAVNAYWLLPVAYFTLTQAEVVLNAKGNVMSTEDTQLMNAGYGNWKDVARLKGYWLSYSDWGDGEFEYLMPEWRDWTDKGIVEVASLGLFVMVVVGLVGGIGYKRDRWSWVWVTIWGMTWFALMSTNPPAGKIFTWLRDGVPLFGQIFRSVFTKWSMVMSLINAIMLGMLVAMMSRWGKNKGLWVAGVVSVAVVCMSMAVVWPVFRGQMISNRMWVQLPEEYMELNVWLKKQPKDKRIAFFPAQTFWGWNFYDWGYRGSGFLWYGIEQPILDRAFDVWSVYNETFYNQFHKAVYDRDTIRVKEVLDQYGVSWVLVDRSVMLPGRTRDSLYVNEFESMMADLGYAERWSKGELSVYGEEVGASESFVQAVGEFRKVNNNPTYSRRDVVYSLLGQYVEGSKLGAEYEFPFSDITKELINNVEIIKDEGQTSVIVTRKAGVGDRLRKLVLPKFTEGTEIFGFAKISYQPNEVVISFDSPVKVSGDGTELYGYQLPEFRLSLQKPFQRVKVGINNQLVEMDLGEVARIGPVKLEAGREVLMSVFNAELAGVLSLDEAFQNSQPVKCWERSDTLGDIGINNKGEVRELVVRDASACLSMRIGEWNEIDRLVLVSVPFKSEKGAKPHFCVVEQGKNECINEDVHSKQNTSSSWVNVERSMVFMAGKAYWMDLVARPPEEKGESWSIDYGPPKVYLYDRLLDVSFKDFWEDFLIEHYVDVVNVENVTVVMGSKVENVRFDLLGRESELACDVFGRGQVSKRMDGTKVIYEASGGASICDLVVLPDVSVGQEYVIKVRGRNVSGRRMKFYVNDLGSKDVVVENLLSNQDTDTSFVLLSRQGENIGYQFNFEGRSFGKEDSVNEVESVELASVPLSWLSSIKTVDEKSTASVEDEIELVEVDKFGTSHYSARVRGDEGLIKLNQGYDQGWVGYEINSKSKIQNSKLMTLFPWFLGEKLEHVKVNGWANGFVLNPKSKIQNLSGEASDGGLGEPVRQVGAQGFGELVDKGEERRVVIIFWSQYLEWLGFGVLGLSVLWLVGSSISWWKTRAR